MNDPTRLSHMEPDSPEAALLRSMRSDAPGVSSKKALIGALGLSAVGGLTGSAAASPAASGLFGSTVAKWLGVVGLCSAALGAGYAAWKSTTPDSRAVLSDSVKMPEFASPAPSQVVPAPPVTSITEQPEARTVPRTTALQPARAGERRESPAASARGLSEEVIALERARRALGDDDGATALKALSEYDHQFKQRTLGPEAEALRIEALLKSGNRTAGKAAAERFLARHPKSPLAKRVRSLMTQTASSK
jgi:hypothetical protein